LIHALALIVCAAEGLNWRWFVTNPPGGSIVMGLPRGYGFSLPIVYLVWILVVFALYWPCRVYAGYKRRHPEKRWLSYL
jgi:presenilin-like A22 family membrane protease